MDHVATIDVVRLQKAKGYSAYDPPDGPTRPSVYEIVARNYPALTDFTYDTEFQELVALETASFVGRSWVASELASFRAGCASGYFCVVADAGLGKTALAADITKREHASAFFFSLAEGRTHLEGCLRHLAVDLIARFSLPHDHLPDRAGKDWAFLKRLLEEAAGQAPQILLVVDGVDEAMEAAGGNTLFLPALLPDGVHIVLTARVDPIVNVRGATRIRTVYLEADDERQRTDIDLFLAQEAARPEVVASLRRRGFDRETFVARLREASAGNFMYLRFVLDDLTADDGAPRLSQFSTLPLGLTRYYEQFWTAMTYADGVDGWKNWNDLYRPTIALLGAAMEPVSAGWISSILGLPGADIDRARARTVETLSAPPETDGTMVDRAQVLFRLSHARSPHRHGGGSRADCRLLPAGLGRPGGGAAAAFEGGGDWRVAGLRTPSPRGAPAPRQRSRSAACRHQRAALVLDASGGRSQR